jgi:sulfur carrier protein ThiS
MIRVKVSQTDRGREVKYKKGMRVRDILDMFNYHPASTLKFVNGLATDDDQMLKDGDELILVSIPGGG